MGQQESIIPKLKSSGYDANQFGYTLMITRRIHGVANTIAYLYKVAQDPSDMLPVLVLDDNMELLKQFIIDMDLKKFNYNLHYISGTINGELFPRFISNLSRRLDKSDYVIAIKSSLPDNSIKPIVVDTTDGTAYSRLPYKHVICIDKSEISKLAEYQNELLIGVIVKLNAADILNVLDPSVLANMLSDYNIKYLIKDRYCYDINDPTRRRLYTELLNEIIQPLIKFN